MLLRLLLAFAASSLALSAAEIETRSTFHCVSLYWTRAEAGPCSVQYRVAGSASWQAAQDLWYDAITETRMMHQYRGSIVNLGPGTAYEIKLRVGPDEPERIVRASTWSEEFTVKKTIRVTSDATFTTSEGGNAAEGYVLYDGTGATIDQQNAAANLATVKHSYVIVRGFTLINAEKDALFVGPDLTDVVIERCDISNWGSQLRPAVNPKWGKIEAGIRVGSTARRVVLQRNRVHHPRYTATKWNEDPADPHPRGPRAIFLGKRADTEDWESNHVVRYNEFFSDKDHLFEDVVGGGVNWSQTGHPGRDSDIYGNIISHATDDLIEADGGGQNVRIWGNYLDYGNVTVSLQSCTIGPVYIFRNIFGHSMASLFGATGGGSGFKFRGNSGATKPTEKGYAAFRGRVYVYHNTRLHAEDFAEGYGLGYKDHVRNVISRNNIVPSAKFYLHDPWDGNELAIPKGHAGDQGAIIAAIKKEAEANPNSRPFNPDFFECSFDYDLHNRNSAGGSVAAVLGRHGVKSDPRWRAGHGLATDTTRGQYQLATRAPGHNAGTTLPNFNRGERDEGGSPDIGAHEHDSPDMQFGVEANWLAL